MIFPKETIQEWCNVLRSGKYKQGTLRLQTNNVFCCLGVACDLYIPSKAMHRSFFGEIVGGMPENQKASPEWLKAINTDFNITTGFSLSELNDIGVQGREISNTFSFDEIADLLEAVYIHEVLKEEAT